MIAVLARSLGPEAFGVVAIATVFVDYFDLFVSQGLGFAIVQRSDLQKQHLDSAFWMNMTVAALLCGLVALAAPLLARLAGSSTVATVLPPLALTLLVSGLSRVQAALLTREMRFRALALVGINSNVAGGLTGVTMAVTGWGVWSLVGQSLARGAMNTVALWLASGWRPSIALSIPHLRALYGYSVKIMADQQLLFLARRFDEGLLGVFLGPLPLGYYVIAKRLVMLVSEFFISAPGSVLFPLFARVQNDAQRLGLAVTSATRLSVVAVIPAFVGLVVLAPESVVLVFGEQWLPAVPAVRLLAIGAPFLLAPVLFHPVFQALGRPGVPLLLNGCRAALGLVLLLIGASFGIMGVAAAYSAQATVAGILDGVALRARTPVPVRPLVILAIRPLLAAVLMALPARVAADMVVVAWGAPTGLFVGALVGAGLFAIVLALIDAPSIRDLLRTIRSAFPARVMIARNDPT